MLTPPVTVISSAVLSSTTVLRPSGTAMPPVTSLRATSTFWSSAFSAMPPVTVLFCTTASLHRSSTAAPSASSTLSMISAPEEMASVTAWAPSQLATLGSAVLTM